MPPSRARPYFDITPTPLFTHAMPRQRRCRQLIFAITPYYADGHFHAIFAAAIISLR